MAQHCNGIELGFVKRESLLRFMDRVPQAWQATTKFAVREEVLVTISPRTGSGRFPIADSVVTAALQRHGEIFKGRRCVYPEYPEVENRRQFLMKLKSPIGSLIRFGVTSFSVSHKGQVRTCYKCGEKGHEARDCDNEVCYRCGEKDHQLVQCTGQAQCVSCGEKGHIHTFCKKSFANKVKLGNMWEAVTTEDVTDEEIMEVAEGEERDNIEKNSEKLAKEGEQGESEIEGDVQERDGASLTVGNTGGQGTKSRESSLDRVKQQQEKTNIVRPNAEAILSQDMFGTPLNLELLTGRTNSDSSSSISGESQATDSSLSSPSSPESNNGQTNEKTSSKGIGYKSSTMTTRAKKVDKINKLSESENGRRNRNRQGFIKFLDLI